MSIVPRSAVTVPFTLTAPPADLKVMLPPGPTAALFRSARICALLPTEIAVPPVALLFSVTLPPLALTRRFPSFEDVSMRELTVMPEFVVMFTEPPAPPVMPAWLFCPVVARIGSLTVTVLVELIVNDRRCRPRRFRVGSASPPASEADLMAVLLLRIDKTEPVFRVRLEAI